MLLEAEGGDPAALEEWTQARFASDVLDGTLAQSAAQGAELWALREGISESLSATGFPHKNDISLPIAALEASDVILFVTSLDVAALRSGAAALAAFRHLGLDSKKIKVVVMRDGTGDSVTVRHARNALGLPVYWRTPSDYPTVVASINAGRPVVSTSPRAKISKNLRELAETLCGDGRTGGGPTRKRAFLSMAWPIKRLSGA